MNALNFINTLVVVVGFPTMVSVFIYIGRKLQKLDDLEYTVRNDVVPGLSVLKERLVVVEDRVETIWKSVKL